MVGEVDGQLIEGFQRSCQYLSSGPCTEGVVELQNGLTRARHCCDGNLCTIGLYRPDFNELTLKLKKKIETIINFGYLQ